MNDKWPINLLMTVAIVALVADGAGAACDQSICSGNPCSVTGHHAVDSGCVFDWSPKTVTIAANASLTAANGQGFTIKAAALDHKGELETAGGDIGLEVSGSASLGGRITTAGINHPSWTSGGDVVVTAGLLTVDGTIDTSGELNVDIDDGDETRTGGSGGAITLDAGTNMLIAGALRSGGNEEDGGDVDLTAVGAVALAGSIRTDSTCVPLPDPDPDFDPACGVAGQAGDVTITAGAAIGITGDISATSKQELGGTVSVTAGADTNQGATSSIVVNGEHASGVGGSISFTANGNLLIAGKLRANGTLSNAGYDYPAEAGEITLTTMGNHGVTIASGARVEAFGDVADGTVTIDPACDLTIDGIIDTRNSPDSEGAITVAYRNGFSGNGKMEAGADGNTIDCRSNGSGSCANPPSGVTCIGLTCNGAALALDPPATLFPRALAPCNVACGNSFVDVGEECDDGNAIPCDGCSPSCTAQGNGSACGVTACDTGGTCSCATASCMTPGTCQGSEHVDCDDANACTTDSPCDLQTGCVHAPVDCDDDDPETTDWCDVIAGCRHRIVRPLAVDELVVLLGELLDPCASTDPAACVLGANACRRLAAAARHQLRLTKLLSSPGQQRVSLRGEAALPTPSTVDLVATGLRVIVADATTHVPVLAASAPAGALDPVTRRGWRLKSSATAPQWTYADKSAAPIGGITKVKIKLNLSTGLVKIGLSGEGAYWIANPANPLTAVVMLEPSAESTDHCLQLSFSDPHGCSPKASSIACK